MDQKKLFYNMCMDLWALGKELDKPRVDMTDEDWTRAIGKMDELTVKYKALGVREHDLISKLMMSILDYVENS
ncbi:hypothetical protein bpr_II411 (plasmid) [Butyrivibrio proteoclasticus B316]|uniref:Uncharacterized protein n=1 Tax=Butyrivibrio proteoclasticus (strain ATCC 51982 / DSM 14932 / B316) TaxID=515622 RepID=E0S4L6_BUTPB|nr:hypothetical protein [Butyrivibrio proteoclasticus]ADL36348.1 hypothetical protein bpr_II411 [Butyrivibrio proteoclasticus B316]